MKCPRCQQDNPAHARFCLGCGSRLALGCAACGAELPGNARFCLQCGQAVATFTAADRSAPPETYTPRHLARPRPVDELAGLRGHVDGLAPQIAQGRRKGAEAIDQGRPLVDQHQVRPPHDSEPAAQRRRRLEGLRDFARKGYS
jgi:ribosomal protein L40E